ncbi:hypothetical protein V2G26_012228 [Clonostachys chloroleuca]
MVAVLSGAHGDMVLIKAHERRGSNAHSLHCVQRLPEDLGTGEVVQNGRRGSMAVWGDWDGTPVDPIGVFDIVHVRFFGFVLLVDDVPSVIERLYKMLKPGGYLQWGDPDIESIRIDRANTEAKTESLADMFKLLAVQDPRLKPTWVTNLPNLFSAAGFVDIEADKNDRPPH